MFQISVPELQKKYLQKNGHLMPTTQC